MKGSRTLIPGFAVVLAMLFSACGGDGSGGENGNGNKDTLQPEVVKVTPQDFPVNELPESYFGKKITEEDGATLSASDQSSFTPSQDKFPDWLEAIVSRESIVLFANGILSAMPDEIEFIQSKQDLWETGSEGWKAFATVFTTRPSSASMVIFGAYKNEKESYWVSKFSKNAISVELNAVTAKDGGVIIGGKGNFKGAPSDESFEAQLTKETATMRYQQIGS